MNGIGEDLISSIDIKALFSNETSNHIDVLGLDGGDQLWYVEEKKIKLPKTDHGTQQQRAERAVPEAEQRAEPYKQSSRSKQSY